LSQEIGKLIHFDAQRKAQGAGSAVLCSRWDVSNIGGGARQGFGGQPRWFPYNAWAGVVGPG
jgi:hypothetical protein